MSTSDLYVLIKPLLSSSSRGLTFLLQVAVMSLTVAMIIRNVEAAHPDVWSHPQIATTLAFICGFIVLALGLLRLGWLVEFIPAPAVSGFMTGSAISIATTQLPSLFGVSGFE